MPNTRITLSSVVFLFAIAQAFPSYGQTALEELERRLFGGSGAAAPRIELPTAPTDSTPISPPTMTASGAVYLGFRGETSRIGGVDVLAVDAAGPAKVAGIRVGDRIVRFDGADISDLGALTRVVGRTKPQQLVSVRMQRGEAQITATMRIASASNLPPPSSASRASLGVSVTPVTDTARRTYGLPVRRGALVTSVTRGGASAKAGVTVGSVIVAVDGKQITNPAELISLVQRSPVGQLLQLSLYEGNRLSVRRVRLEAAQGALADSAADNGAMEGRLGEGGRRPVLGALGRLLDDVIRDGRPVSPPTAGAPATTPPGPTAPPAEPLGIRADQMELVIEELRALRLTVEMLQRRIERLESSGGKDDAKLDLKPTSPPKTEDLPEPKQP